MAKASSPSNPSSGQDSDFSRRGFVRTVGATALAASMPMPVPLAGAHAVLGGSAHRKEPSVAETPIARFFRSLSAAQRSRICFPYEHPLRMRAENNWAIVEPRIGDLTTEQQALCREIFRNLCSEEGHERFLRQMNDDAGGFENYHVALFGEPGIGHPFEWVLTGRHNTLRADGQRHAGVAFSGPIFYGHAVEAHGPTRPDHAGNVWRYQADQANAILLTLDGRQRAQALSTPGAVGIAGSDSAGDGSAGRGLAVAGLDTAQKRMVQQLLKGLIRLFRGFDAEEIQECLRDDSGADKLRLTYSRAGHPGTDRGWDLWKLQGPAFTWHFHGTPHVHSWLNLTRRPPSD